MPIINYCCGYIKIHYYSSLMVNAIGIEVTFWIDLAHNVMVLECIMQAFNQFAFF